MSAESHDCACRDLLVLLDDVATFLGVELLRERSRSNEVAEENGQMAPLAVGSFLMLRNNTIRSGWSVGNADRRSALAAKSRCRRVLESALHAPLFERRAALLAELEPFRIVRLAV